MGPSRFPWIALALATLVMAGGCSSGDEGADDDDTGDTEAPVTTAEESEFVVQVPTEIAPPPAEGDGPSLPQPAPSVPEGWVEQEYLIGGTATAFDAADTPDDGFWSATPAEEQDYRTRVIVRRPEAAEDFSGTVLVEWFNVSAIEASPDWAYLSQEIQREGHAYIGVSAQAQGVEGGDTILEVEVDQGDAAAAGVSTDTSGLKNVDPDRYGTLSHPGDPWSFDMFTQVGLAATDASDDLLGGLEPTQVLAMGESQSAGFLSTLVNAVHPLDPVFDGFLVHSRGAGTPPLDGNYVSVRDAEDPAEALTQGVLIRTDLDVPVLIFETETDLTLLGYASARQEDTDLIRTWEVAGLAHADAHFVRSIIGGPRDPNTGSLLGCDNPINTGPQHEVVQAALHHLVEWSAGGSPPPEADRIELSDGEEMAIERDELGIAIGGVRHPLVDVPVATISGDPPGGESITDLLAQETDICILFGSTTALDRDQLLELYGTADAYVDEFGSSAQQAVDDGFLLQYNADELLAEAEVNRQLFG